MADDNIAFLTVRTWKGMLGIASHYYGTIVYGDRELPDIEVRRKLTANEAKDLNKLEDLRDGEGTKGYRYKVGDRSGAFLSREALINEARKIFRQSLAGQDVRILILGNRASAQVQPIIAHASKYTSQAQRINRLYEEAVKIDFWEEDEEAMTKINKEWEKLFEEITK